MFTGRQARAVLVISSTWGVLHGLFGAFLGAWFIFRMGHHQWEYLPVAMWSYALSSVWSGLVAGLVFCALLRRFERSLTVGTLSATRVVGWGILASIPVFSMMMYGTLPDILLDGYFDTQLLLVATVRSALAGGVVAALTLAIARFTSRPTRPAVEHRLLLSRLLSSGRISRIIPSRWRKKEVVEFVGIPVHSSWIVRRFCPSPFE